MKSSYLLSILIALGVANMAIPASAQEELSPMCANEQTLIEEVTNQGIGDRYRISTTWEVPEGNPARATRSMPIPGMVAIGADCPGDRAPASFGGGGGGVEPLSQWPHGSVIRFKGTHALGDFTFIGDEDDPLSFIILRQHGLVYLHGTGQVIEPDGEEINF